MASRASFAADPSRRSSTVRIRVRVQQRGGGGKHTRRVTTRGGWEHLREHRHMRSQQVPPLVQHPLATGRVVPPAPVGLSEELQCLGRRHHKSLRRRPHHSVRPPIAPLQRRWPLRGWPLKAPAVTERHASTEEELTPRLVLQQLRVRRRCERPVCKVADELVKVAEAHPASKGTESSRHRLNVRRRYWQRPTMQPASVNCASQAILVQQPLIIAVGVKQPAQQSACLSMRT